MVVTFCEAVRAAGYTPMVYANPYWCSTYLDMTRLGAYDLWLAHYNVDSPSTKNPFTIWQYTSTGSVPGISGNVDLDYSYINYPAGEHGTTVVNTLQCDTGSPYSFGTNSSYIYKITTAAVVAPKAVSSNSSAVTVAFYGKTSGGYLYRITNVNAGTAVITTAASDGSSASFTAYGKASGFISDTPAAITMVRSAAIVSSIRWSTVFPISVICEIRLSSSRSKIFLDMIVPPCIIHINVKDSYKKHKSFYVVGKSTKSSGNIALGAFILRIIKHSERVGKLNNFTQ